MNPPVIPIQDYTYELPDEKIALHPLPERDQSKLLVYKESKIIHSTFSYVGDFLPQNSILFFNNTKVIPARLFFKKDTGAIIEVFLLHPVWPSAVVAIAMSARGKCRWHCTIGNLKKWTPNSKLQIAIDQLKIEATLIDREKAIVELEWNLPLQFSEVIQKIGAIPLPPYIKRKAEVSDTNRYQTVYSKEDGAVAAPTAGLHFTEKVFSSLREKKIETAYLTLHVSAGTFQPVKVENAKEHIMHSEQVVVTKQNIEQLLSEKEIVAVGTTSLRTLESIYWYGVKLIKDPSAEFIIEQNDAYQLNPVPRTASLHAVLEKMRKEETEQLLGETSIYILPGYNFKIANALITNFHQPGSTLMLLVAAFIGENWKKVYNEALTNEYRFLSYGDSSLLFRNKF
ncbi:S-adenosylmethionine:tRNA ribosyltransferase-isomerase [Cytophagales bacterium WSM2-2]|nr:S-adenosylmethionine:tRNA ribosyltransferase-isomerase [Cytophagales bacterium WSM2-2]